MKTPSEEQKNMIPEATMQSLAIHLGNMEKALLEKDPLMKDHLRESHRLLITYPETVHLLDDSEIRALIAAAEEYTQVKIVAETASKKGRGSKKEINAALDL